MLSTPTTTNPANSLSQPRWRSLSWRKKLLYTIVCVVAVYCLLEALFALAYMRGYVFYPSVRVVEDTGALIARFDPVCGYHLGKTPLRMACFVSGGSVESMGHLKGNNYGFPDRDDFHKERVSSTRKRFAVFGDSFTACQFIEQNWPDRVEDLLAGTDQPMQLLNFSVDGGGLVNWWSILTRCVGPEGFDLDGVIFCVALDDLYRPFRVLDDSTIPTPHTGQRAILFGGCPIGTSGRPPETMAQARPHLDVTPFIVAANSVNFDAMLRGQWAPTVELSRQFELHLTKQLLGLLLAFGGAPAETPPRGFDSGQSRIIEEIRKLLDERRLPVLVVQVPEQRCLQDGMVPAAEFHQDTRRFAQLLGARFVDGTKAFEGLDGQAIDKCFIPYDGHWNQTGSNRFARFMSTVIRQLE